MSCLDLLEFRCIQCLQDCEYIEQLLGDSQIRVKAGTLARLSVHVPVSLDLSGAISVRLEGLHILLCPSSPSDAPAPVQPVAAQNETAGSWWWFPTFGLSSLAGRVANTVSDSLAPSISKLLSAVLSRTCLSIEGVAIALSHQNTADHECR